MEGCSVTAFGGNIVNQHRLRTVTGGSSRFGTTSKSGIIAPEKILSKATTFAGPEPRLPIRRRRLPPSCGRNRLTIFSKSPKSETGSDEGCATHSHRPCYHLQLVTRL